MKKHNKKTLLRFIAVGLLVGAGLFASCAKPNNPIAPAPPSHLITKSDTLPHGKSWEAWAGSWWNWFYSMPSYRNPLYDSAAISAGQTGDVWFLGGTFAVPDSAGSTVTRTGTVPLGTALLIPILNFKLDTVGGSHRVDSLMIDAGLAWSSCTRSESIIVDLKLISDTVLHFVPGTSLFSLSYPDSNFSGIPKTVATAVSCGDYLMIDGLGAGKHTIRWFTQTYGGTAADVYTNVVYNLTVK